MSPVLGPGLQEGDRAQTLERPEDQTGKAGLCPQDDRSPGRGGWLPCVSEGPSTAVDWKRADKVKRISNARLRQNTWTPVCTGLCTWKEMDRQGFCVLDQLD